MKAACDKFVPELRKINPANVYSVSGYAYDFLSIYAAAIKESGATTGKSCGQLSRIRLTLAARANINSACLIIQGR